MIKLFMYNVYMNKISKISMSVLVVIIIAIAAFAYYRKSAQEATTAPEEDISFDAQDYTEKATDILPPENASEQATTSSNTNTSASPKSSEYNIEIAKINITAPIILNIDGNNKEEYNKALENGVAHMAKTALPGENGNFVLFGHSSYYANKPGSFKEVFATLDRLNVGDTVTVTANNKTYTYKVTEEKTVSPSDVSVVNQDKSKKIMTLITCWPPKTTTNRYIIIATLE